jgi:hypothetical protein
MKKNLVIETISGLLVLLFVYTALNKLLNTAQFAYTISRVPLIEPFAGFLSFAAPVTELLISAALIFPPTRLAGLYAAFLLMAAFTVYVTAMVFFLKDLPCSCGGVLKDLTWKQHIAFNLFFTAISAFAIKIYPHKNLVATTSLPVQQDNYR